jgi:hypothetical protein
MSTLMYNLFLPPISKADVKGPGTTKVLFAQKWYSTEFLSTQVRFFQSPVLPKSGLLQNGTLQNSVLPKSVRPFSPTPPSYFSLQILQLSVYDILSHTVAQCDKILTKTNKKIYDKSYNLWHIYDRFLKVADFFGLHLPNNDRFSRNKRRLWT